jgi:hypothetical protein
MLKTPPEPVTSKSSSSGLPSSASSAALIEAAVAVAPLSDELFLPPKPSVNVPPVAFTMSSWSSFVPVPPARTVRTTPFGPVTTSTLVKKPKERSKENPNRRMRSFESKVAVSVPGARPRATESLSSRPWMLWKLKSSSVMLPSPFESGFSASPLLKSGSRMSRLNARA